MDDHWRTFVWAVAGGGLLGVLGLLFGALTGVLTRLDGRAAGGIIGRTVLRKINQVRERPLSSTVAAGIVGGAEGTVFLGVFGVLLGALIGYLGLLTARMGLLLGLGGVVLVLAAALFGVLAYLLSWSGPRAVGLVCLAALLGALVGGSWTGGGDGLLIGTLTGVLAGVPASLVLFRPSGLPRSPRELEGPDLEDEPR